MRELTVNELTSISGAWELGTGAGGLFSAANVGAATRLIAGIGALYTAWEVGTRIGRGIYSSSAYQNLLSD